MNWWQAFLKAWESSCGAKGMATLVIPANYQFLLSPLMLKGPCLASTIQIQVFLMLMLHLQVKKKINFNYIKVACCLQLTNMIYF